MSWRFGRFLVLALLLPWTARAEDDGKGPKGTPEKRPAVPPVERVFKGTLTPLEQKVWHNVQLKKNQDYAISLDPQGFFIDVKIEDDQGKKVHALTTSGTFKAPADGAFRLWVSSPGGSCGQYVLGVRALNLTPTKQGEVLTVSKEGLVIDGMLTKGDPLDKVRKKYCRTYDVKMTGGKTYVIDLISKQFDAYLRLEDPKGKQLAQDDDSGGGNNARLKFRAPADGAYRIIATSFGLETGLFLLKVREE